MSATGDYHESGRMGVEASTAAEWFSRLLARLRDSFESGIGGRGGWDQRRRASTESDG
ncbi:hypothetical protein ACRALDRAFT_2036250 [Sodiomyces alcalophilus JCM 7366]|uniref:uncharacterized protein n=1 Tax=Sodiomyces alcalophilus JCM 7366 TaxID=591952 RepID=UPI0039B4EFF7